MDLKEKIELVAEILEIDSSDFNLETQLDTLEQWDSMAALSYIVVMGEKFGISPKPEDVKNLKTIQDIVDSMK
jgi:hypothetical protein